ncbi:MAG: hypothetical protein D6820_13640, partial [Lentisphaerae bacterium]
DEERLSNFRELYRLPPEIIELLKTEKVGNDPMLREQDLQWLRKLPKADLHCHFGGILHAPAMIQVAQTLEAEIESYRHQLPAFHDFLDKLTTLVRQRHLPAIHSHIGTPRELRTRFPGLPQPFAVAAVILAFRDDPDLLDQYIFSSPDGVLDYRDPNQFHAVGITSYITLGDLQGSALMQHRATIHAACEYLQNYCRQHNVIHLELRCSPVKYTEGELSEKQVLNIFSEHFPQFPILIIASRHGRMSEIFHTIELIEEIFSDPARREASTIAGVDLAGPENTRAPFEVRNAFVPVFEYCLPITIHAGENPQRLGSHNIWEAIYHLQADRLGHALSLLDSPDLLNKLIDRGTGLELCPSSNRQIVGFTHPDVPGSHAQDVYPLKEYLNRGLRVTVNTDNPAMSRTDITREFYEAARMSNGLSRWEIMQLIRNALRVSFHPGHESRGKRKELILEAERMIIDILHQQYQSIRINP